MKYIFNVYTFVFILFFIIAVYITYPLIFNMTKLVSSLGDEYLIIWIQNWVIHALSTNPWSLFDAPIFYPHLNTLAYSDAFITSSIIALPFLLFFQEPVITVNITLFLSIVMLGFSVFCLSYYLTKNSCISFLSGVMVIFSPVILDKMTHLQVLSIWGVPLSILFLLKFLDTKRVTFFLYAATAFVLQTYNSFLPGYFILCSWGIIFFGRFVLQRESFKNLATKQTVTIVFLSVIFLVPLIFPYMLVKNELSFKRDIRDAIHYGLHIEDLVVGNSYTKFEPILQKVFPQDIYHDKSQIKVGYPGLLFFLLGVPSLLYFLRHKKKDITYGTVWAISIISFVISLGPALHLGRATIHHPFPIILPYAVLYYVVPGFDGMRNSARWEVLFVIGMSILTALFVNRIVVNTSYKKQLFIYSLIAFILLVEFNNPDRFVAITQKKDFPPVYTEIANLPKKAVIVHLPMYTWNMFPYGIEELKREYYSVSNFHSMVNGASGITPPEWEELAFRLMRTFPNNNSIQELKMRGVMYVVVHFDEYTVLHMSGIQHTQMYSVEEIRELLSKSSQIKEYKKIDMNTTIYRIY